jgi:pyrroloquinoline quinone biosynthesis protein E
VTFAGGEPLLREDLEELLAHTKQYDFDTNITTNGLIATPDRVLALAQAGLKIFTFSLDTLDPEIYQLVRGVPLKPVLRNIKKTIDNRALLKNMSLAISLVVSRPTIDSVPEVIRFATTNNLSINIQVVHPAWYSEWFDKDHKYSEQVQFREEDEPRLQALIQEILTMKNEGYNIITNSAYLEGIPGFGTRKAMPKDFHCLSGYDAISINVGLDVYSCIDAGVMGNLRKDKLEDLWFSKKWQEHRQKMYDLKCSKCWIICHTEGLPDNYKAVFRD